MKLMGSKDKSGVEGEFERGKMGQGRKKIVVGNSEKGAKIEVCEGVGNCERENRAGEKERLTNGIKKGAKIKVRWRVENYERKNRIGKNSGQ